MTPLNLHAPRPRITAHKCVCRCYVLSGIESSHASLLAQLDASQKDVDALIRETRQEANAQLVTAKELALLRHSLADELSSLAEELDSSIAADDSGPSLLEEIEVLHRNLKELQSVKGYVEVIHRALQLR